MSHSLAKTVLHMILFTKERCPFHVRAPLRDQLCCYDGEILVHFGCQPDTGGVADHVHLLAALFRRIR